MPLQTTLLRRVARYAASPQGRALANRAKRYAQSPEGRAKIDRARKQIAARREARARTR